MSVISPTILATDIEDCKYQVQRLQPFAERVQIDITDGVFAANKTVDLGQISWPENWKVDLHLMVSKPSEYLDLVLKMKPNMVIFHAEVEENLVPIFEKIKSETLIKPAVALLRSTVPETVAPAIQTAEHVLIFSGNLGEMGGKASMMQLEKIRLVKKINPNVEIGWDGGANEKNVFALTQGGVDVVNVGSAISRAENPEAVYRAMANEVSRKGAI